MTAEAFQLFRDTLNVIFCRKTLHVESLVHAPDWMIIFSSISHSHYRNTPIFSSFACFCVNHSRPTACLSFACQVHIHNALPPFTE